MHFFWSIVALWCCVNFQCSAKWISHTYTYPLSLLAFLPIHVTTVHQVEFPFLHSMFSLTICFIHSVNSVCVSIPVPPTPLSPWYPSICSLYLYSCFCFAQKIIYAIFLDSIYICINIWYLFFSFWLTSLSLILSQSIHVSANVPYFVSFYDWVIFHCIYVPHLLYLFLCWWTFRL